MKEFVIKVAILIVFAFSVSITQAQEGPADIIKNFFKKYEKNPGAAFDYLYSNNEWMQRSQDDIDNLKMQVQNATTLIGTYQGYELLDTRKLGESFVLYSYLIKYQRQPMRFVFEFYKPESQWKTYGFSYDKNPDTDLENSSREAIGK